MPVSGYTKKSLLIKWDCTFSKRVDIFLYSQFLLFKYCFSDFCNSLNVHTQKLREVFAEATDMISFVVGNNMQSVLGRADGVLTLEKYTKTILSSLNSKHLGCTFSVLHTNFGTTYISQVNLIF